MYPVFSLYICVKPIFYRLILTWTENLPEFHFHRFSRSDCRPLKPWLLRWWRDFWLRLLLTSTYKYIIPYDKILLTYKQINVQQDFDFRMKINAQIKCLLPINCSNARYQSLTKFLKIRSSKIYNKTPIFGKYSSPFYYLFSYICNFNVNNTAKKIGHYLLSIISSQKNKSDHMRNEKHCPKRRDVCRSL